MATVVQYNKYERLKKQVSLDGGVTWNDVVPIEYMTGNLLEVNSRDCGYSLVYQWSGQTIDGHAVSIEEVSYNNGAIWEATGKIRVDGQPIDMRDALNELGQPLEDYIDNLEANAQDYMDSLEEDGSGDVSSGDSDPEPEEDSDDISYLSVYLYQKWVKHSGQSNFVPAWPIEYATEDEHGWSTTKDDHDPECGYVPEVDPQYRWIVDGYVCVEETVEVHTIYRWADTGRYICVNGDKYALQIRQKSDDNGITWTDVSPAVYQRGALIEADSTDCSSLLDAEYYFSAPGEYEIALDRGGRVQDVWLDGNNVDFSGESIKVTVSSARTYHVNFSLSGTQVPSYMFANNDYLHSIVIPSKFTNIGYYAFSGCDNLSYVVMEGITSINIGAFEDCNSIAEIDFPETLISIDDEAFRRCRSLEVINIFTDLPPMIEENTIYNSPLTAINVTSQAYQYYLDDQYWSEFASIIRPTL